MYGLIIHEMKSKYFTNLKEVFDVLGKEVKKYNWLLSDYECNKYLPEIPLGREFIWFDEIKLEEILAEHEIQFIWGVATAFEKNTPLIDILQYPLPSAEKDITLGKTNVAIQNPLAEIELIAYDSTLMLVISKSEEYIKLFSKEYPNSIVL